MKCYRVIKVAFDYRFLKLHVNWKVALIFVSRERKRVTVYCLSEVDTDCMEQDPWEADNHSDGEEFLLLFWNSKFYWPVHKSWPLRPTRSHTNAVHMFTCLSLRYILILLFLLRLALPNGLFSSGFQPIFVSVSYLSNPKYRKIKFMWSCY